MVLQCGLYQDLKQLPHGDLTQIGERGLTLRYASTLFGIVIELIRGTQVGGKGYAYGLWNDSLWVILILCIQARITLARAVYSTAKILLLDDILAALDIHTAKWVCRQCFAGSLMCGRTVILVVSPG